jgi:hypothetical protein
MQQTVPSITVTAKRKNYLTDCTAVRRSDLRQNAATFGARQAATRRRHFGHVRTTPSLASATVGSPSTFGTRAGFVPSESS